MIVAYVINLGTNVAQILSTPDLCGLNLDEVDVLEIGRLSVPSASVGEAEVVHLASTSIDKVAAKVICVAPVVRRDIGDAALVGAAVFEAGTKICVFVALNPWLPVEVVRVPVAHIWYVTCLAEAVAPSGGRLFGCRTVVGDGVVGGVARGAVFRACQLKPLVVREPVAVVILTDPDDTGLGLVVVGITFDA